MNNISMKSPIFDGSQKSCYGCEACSQICPHGAISMEANFEGFLYPNVDENKCVHCGSCKKVCPAQGNDENPVFLNPSSNHVYAAWSKNTSIRMDSTSGGIFSELAHNILQRNGVVYGCAWKNGMLVAMHIRIDEETQLGRLRGSKYVQSEVGTTFRDAKRDLQSGRVVLYSGTPCQIAALKLFLGKEYVNLYLVDLVCHGVPSPKIFEEYIQYVQVKTGQILNGFKFRAKKKSGWRSYVEWVFKNSGELRMTPVGLDPFSHAFHEGFLSRESCYQCRFSRFERPGDITLSDFWGGEKIHRQLGRVRKFGFSMIMCNSVKGKNMTESILPKIEWIQSNAEAARASDPRLRNAGERPNLRSNIYIELSENGFAWMVKNRFLPRHVFIRKVIPNFIKNALKEMLTRFGS